MTNNSLNHVNNTLMQIIHPFLFIFGAVALIMGVVGMVNICEYVMYRLSAKTEYHPQKDVSSTTGHQPRPHSQFNPKLLEKDVPLPSHPNLNNLSTIHAISITKPERHEINSHIMAKLMANGFTSHSSMLINIGLLSSKKQVPITKYHSATNNTLRMINSEWQPIHESSLEITINLIREAIAQNYNNIIITYNYDGVWAYAAGYWDAKNDPVVNNYVNDLEALSHQINIYFSKLTPYHTNDSIVNQLINKVDKL